MKKRNASVGTAAVLLLCSGMAAFGQPNYRITDLGTLPDCTAAVAYGINDKGEVVGMAFGAGKWHGFLYSNGSMKQLANLVWAGGINNAEQIVGTAESTNQTKSTYAAIYDHGIVTDLGTLPGFTASQANAINQQGQIVGSAYGTNGMASHAFLYSDGTTKDLGCLPGYTNSYAEAINNAGMVVGSSGDGPMRQHAFLYQDGRMTDLGTLGGDYSVALGINDQGEIAGEATTEFGEYHAFFFSNGTMRDLNTSEWGFSSTQGIDAAGRIVGVYRTEWGELHAFVEVFWMRDLNYEIDQDSGWKLGQANAINQLGQIVGEGINPAGIERAYLLTPIVRLQMQRVGPDLRLSWNIDEADAELIQSTTPSGPWSAVTNEATRSLLQEQVTIPGPLQGQRYYKVE
jgi:probable HAF family extracellular repeat protein